MSRSNQTSFKYLDIIIVSFAVVLIISNLVGAVKIIRLTIPFTDISFSCSCGLFLFPITYLVGDVLTEVYGYAKSRRVIWTGFVALLLVNLVIQFFVALPPDPNWGLNDEFNKIFAAGFRISIASMIAYYCGEFTNSYIIAKLKLLTKGKYQGLRIIASTAAGELVDTTLILFIGFYGAEAYPMSLLMTALYTNYIFKVLWEIIVYPIFTVHILKFLKKEEQIDYYDHDTDFNPFHIDLKAKAFEEA